MARTHEPPLSTFSHSPCGHIPIARDAFLQGKWSNGYQLNIAIVKSVKSIAICEQRRKNSPVKTNLNNGSAKSGIRRWNFEHQRMKKLIQIFKPRKPMDINSFAKHPCPRLCPRRVHNFQAWRNLHFTTTALTNNCKTQNH